MLFGQVPRPIDCCLKSAGLGDYYLCWERRKVLVFMSSSLGTVNLPKTLLIASHAFGKASWTAKNENLPSNLPILARAKILAYSG